MYKTIIADDEKRICDAIVSVLNTAVPELNSLQVFHDGAAAFEHVRLHGGDILLLDIEMPGKTGLDIAQLVADRGDDCFVVIITAYQDFEYAKRAIDCNVNAYLTKPFSSQQLVETVRKGIAHLEKNRSRLESRHRSNRSLLQAMCADHAISLYGDIRLCGGTAALEDLLCTEVLIKDDGLAVLQPEAKETLEKALRVLAETDQVDASAFLMECRETVRILVFSREAPADNSFDELAGLVSRYTGNPAAVTVKTWHSFRQYRRSLEFASETEGFFQQVMDSNYKQAHEAISQYVSGLSKGDRLAMAAYLEENYAAQCGTEAEQILQCLDTLARQSLPSQSGNHIVSAACGYIRQHFSSSSLSLETTAEALAVSSAHLSRLLKKYTGYTFSAYLQKTRMEHAKSLLETTNLATTEVASASGYDNPAYFRTSFKAYFHMTPRQYRQLACGKENSES